MQGVIGLQIHRKNLGMKSLLFIILLVIFFIDGSVQAIDLANETFELRLTRKIHSNEGKDKYAEVSIKMGANGEFVMGAACNVDGKDEAITMLAAIPSIVDVTLRVDNMFSLGNRVITLLTGIERLSTLRLVGTDADLAKTDWKSLARLPLLKLVTITAHGGKLPAGAIMSLIAEQHDLQDRTIVFRGIRSPLGKPVRESKDEIEVLISELSASAPGVFSFSPTYIDTKLETAITVSVSKGHNQE